MFIIWLSKVGSARPRARAQVLYHLEMFSPPINYLNRCRHWLIKRVQERLGCSKAGATLDQRSTTQELCLANDDEIEQILPGWVDFSDVLQ